MLGLNEIKNKFTAVWTGDDRSRLLMLNIVISYAVKGLSIIISLIIVPLTINFLSPVEYGIWLTLSSILMWASYFDVGLGNGLRNLLTRSIAINDIESARKLISTTFAIITIIMFVFFSVFFIANLFLDWTKILNTDLYTMETLNQLVLIVFGFFCLQFIFKNTGIVLIALQKPALNDLIIFLGNLLSLLLLLFFVYTSSIKGSLVHVSIIFSIAPLVIMVLATIFLFKRQYLYLKPKFKFVDFKLSKDLMGLGIQFFIIQITTCVVIYTSTNIIISQVISPEHVTVFNIAYKYFYIVTMLFNIVLAPYWSSATDAYVKQDFKWLKSAILRLNKLFVLVVGALLLMVVVSKYVYVIWIGDAVSIPFYTSFWVAIYTLIFNWSNLYIYFINGFGKIRIQLIVSIVLSLLYIPLALKLGDLFGLNGIIVASSLIMVPFAVIMPIQAYKIVYNRARGIWNK